ncbi:MAG: hypothetical protein KF774_20925 [Planctomyces sp.]|nr:hypothetical protein [Planctomyces sp.]
MATDNAAAPIAVAAQRLSRGRRLAWAAAFVSLTALVGGGLWTQSGLTRGRTHLANHSYPAARAALRRYLWLHPGDSDARAALADAWALDDELDPDVAAERAIAELQRIPDDAPGAAAARTLEGRLAFLILRRPTAAERLFQRSIELQPDQFDAHYLLWKLYDMTERYFSSEPAFWAAYERTPPADRAVRLREWFLSQFAPFSACAELDGLMGFRSPNQPTDEVVALGRLESFKSQEPQSPMLIAAIAQWCLRNDQPGEALAELESLKDSAADRTDRFYVAALAETLVQLGQYERAEEVFTAWPLPDDRYAYWRIAGIIEQDVRQDHARAIECYDRALELWPGPSDWQTMRRKAHCLARAGDAAGAEALRTRAQLIEDQMELELHQRLREALSRLDDPAGLERIAEFYETLKRPREAAEWRQVIGRIEPRAGTPEDVR